MIYLAAAKSKLPNKRFGTISANPRRIAENPRAPCQTMCDLVRRSRKTVLRIESERAGKRSAGRDLLEEIRWQPILRVLVAERGAARLVRRRQPSGGDLEGPLPPGAA
jgi:hypothetical protein